MTLESFFKQYPETAVAFSGGTDSAYLLYAAVKYARRVRAYYVKTPFQPEFELEDALRLAEELSADLKVIRMDILSDEQIVSNPENRCYFCKHLIFTEILKLAAGEGFPVLLDGTNASDSSADRPGMKALKELSVLSPLRLCGLTKSDIRIRSKEAGLFTWEKPSYACLATRIPTGQRIEAQGLRRTEQAESFLSGLGFLDFRVRTSGDDAVLQIREEQIPLLVQHRETIYRKLSGLYHAVLMDLKLREAGCETLYDTTESEDHYEH